MPFQINSTTPPAAATPAGDMLKVIYPTATDFDGQGNPVGATGGLQGQAGRHGISATGHAWYMGFFSSDPDALSVDVTNVQIYDDLTESWRTFSTAKMHRPVWQRANPGVWYEEYVVRFTALTP